MHISLFLFNGASAAAAGPPSWSFPAWRNSRLLEADWKAFLRQSGLLDPFAAKDAQTGGALSGDRTDGHFEVRSCSLQPLETGESNATIVLRLLHLTDNSLKNLPASSMQKANLDLCIAEESCFQGKPRDARPSAKAGSRQEPTSATTRLPPGLPRPGCTSTSDLFENAPTQEPLAPEFSCARC